LKAKLKIELEIPAQWCNSHTDHDRHNPLFLRYLSVNDTSKLCKR